MADQEGGKLVYEVDIETAGLIEGSKKAKAEISSLGDEVGKTAPSFDKMTKGAKGVSSALAMPEVNKLSNQLAQLSGKIGASSDAANNATVAQNKFSGALSTAASKLGAGYVSNVGSATNSLISHAKEAFAATDAQMASALAAQRESVALKEKASQLVLAAVAEKKSAEAAELSATTDLEAAEALFTRKEAQLDSLEQTLLVQKATLKQTESNIALMGSEKEAAQAIKEKAAIAATEAKIIKQTNQAVAEVTAAEDKVTKAKEASAIASQKVTQAVALEAAAKKTVATANDAAALATEKLTLAARAQAVAVAGARSALALLGGPAGVLLLAAAGVYSLYQAMSGTKEIEEFNKKIDDSIDKIETLNNAQAKYASDKFGSDLESLTEKQKKYALEIENTQRALATAPVLGIEDQVTEKLNRLKALYDDTAQSVLRLAEASDRADSRARDTANMTMSQVIAQNALKEATKSLTEQNKLLATSILDGDGAAKDAIEIEKFGQKLNKLGIYGQDATDAIERFASELQQNKDFALAGAVEDTRQKVEELTIRLKEGEQAAIKFNAQMTVKNNGWDANSKDAKDYIANQQKIAALNKQISDQKKSDTASKSAAKKDANAAETVAQKLANLKQQSELAADSTRELSREQAILTAQQSLGSAATQKDIELAGKYAAAKWDTGNAIRAQAAAEKLIAEKGESSRYEQETKDLNTALSAKKISQEQYDKASEKSEQEHQTNLAKIRSDAVVSPQQEAAGLVDPVQALANENAKKLKLIQQFEDNKTITEQQGLQLRRAANKQYEQERTDAMFQLWSQQTIGNEVAANALNAFGQSASSALSGVITGTQSASDAMLGLANTVLSSVIQTFVDMGIQQAKSAIMGATVQQSAIAATTTAQVAGIATQTTASTAAAATTTAAWTPAALVASVASFGGAAAIGAAALIGVMALSGKRKNGGPVSAGGMYQVGEGGMPEIYQSSSGRQYMIPGDNGSVISNKDLQGSGGGSSGGVIVNINNYTPATVDMQQTPNANGGITVDLFIADMNAGGPMSQSITSNTTASRRAQNQ